MGVFGTYETNQYFASKNCDTSPNSTFYCVWNCSKQFLSDTVHKFTSHFTQYQTGLLLVHKTHLFLSLSSCNMRNSIISDIINWYLLLASSTLGAWLMYPFNWSAFSFDLCIFMYQCQSHLNLKLPKADQFLVRILLLVSLKQPGIHQAYVHSAYTSELLSYVS